MALTSSTPVVRVEDYPRARAFYESLGFSIAEEGGDPARFGIFKRDAATIFVDSWGGADAQPSTQWSAYFHTDDLDAFAAELSKIGIAFEGPDVKVYGMREVLLQDPDGNLLCFGQDA